MIDFQAETDYAVDLVSTTRAEKMEWTRISTGEERSLKKTVVDNGVS